MNFLKKCLLFLIIFSLVIGIDTLPASAFVKNGRHVTSTLTFVPYSGFGSTSRTHMSNAAATWSARVSDFTLATVSSSTHSDATGYYTRDYHNYIYRTDCGEGYVATTTTWASGSVTSECDINMNMHYAWANSAQPNHYDVYSVILHEFGHTLGLADVRDTRYYTYDSTVMWYAVKTNSTKRSLKTDDINGIDDIYN